MKRLVLVLWVLALVVLMYRCQPKPVELEPVKEEKVLLWT